VRLFIDECLSPTLVALAKERAIEADFVVYLGKQGWQDHNLARFAVENGYTFATNNRRDFLKQYAGFDSHPGLIVIVPLVGRARQQHLFNVALDHLAVSEPTNRLVEIDRHDVVHVRPWSLTQHDLGHIANPDWAR
jgi:predicted nuclease of predicted toxin-antitoxin system